MAYLLFSSFNFDISIEEIGFLEFWFMIIRYKLKTRIDSIDENQRINKLDR